MVRSFSSVMCTTLALVIAQGCSDDDDSQDSDGTQTESGSATDGDQDGEADGGVADGGDGATGDGTDAGGDGGSGGSSEADRERLRASCETFCDAQAECLGLTAEQCTADCMTQESMLGDLSCAAEGAGENECMATLTCDELRDYATSGRRANATCGAAATAYFAACTPGESDACTAMCARYQACDALPTSVGACEESCLLRITNLAWSVNQGCADAFEDVASCIAEASCESLTAMSSTGALPESCAAANDAQSAACR